MISRETISPFPSRNAPRSMTRRSSWIRSPYSVPVPTHSLKPLNSGGLWLPVIMTPPSAPKWWMAK